MYTTAGFTSVPTRLNNEHEQGALCIYTPELAFDRLAERIFSHPSDQRGDLVIPRDAREGSDPRQEHVLSLLGEEAIVPVVAIYFGNDNQLGAGGHEFEDRIEQCEVLERREPASDLDAIKNPIGWGEFDERCRLCAESGFDPAGVTCRQQDVIDGQSIEGLRGLCIAVEQLYTWFECREIRSGMLRSTDHTNTGESHKQVAGTSGYASENQVKSVRATSFGCR